MRLMTSLVLVALVAACSTTPTQPTLYERLGEQDGITTIVDNLLYELGGNDTLLPFLPRPTSAGFGKS